MDSITSLIKKEIKRQYSTLKHFSEISGIPYSTLSNALAKGVGGTSYETVVKVCKLLNIKQSYDSELVLFNEKFHEFYTKLSALDDQGMHTVNTVLNMEYNRCVGKEPEPVVRGFNNIGIGIKTENEE